MDLGAPFISDFPRRVQPRHPPTPLVVVQCKNCGLVQLLHTAPREWMYSEYFYKSGINESMVAALKDVVEKATTLVDVGIYDVVMDIGANDGTLLRLYKDMLGKLCPRRIGVDPALNLHKDLKEHCELIVPDYFPPETTYTGKKAKIVTSIAMFYDLEDPNAFVAEVAKVLDDNGVWVVQFTDLWDTIRLNAFDNFVHEHLAYYDFSTFASLVAFHGMHVVDCERNSVNGGSIRYYVVKEGAKGIQAFPGAFDRLRGEIQNDLKITPEAFAKFKANVAKCAAKVRKVVEETVVAGGCVDVLGASTKGNTLLQYFGLDSNAIRRAVDRSETKNGRYCVGSWIPVVNEKEGHQEPAEVMLVLPWSFREGLIAREKDYLRAGGKLLFPLPTPQLVTKDSVEDL